MPKAKPKKSGPKAARLKLNMGFEEAVQKAVKTPKNEKPATRQGQNPQRPKAH